MISDKALDWRLKWMMPYLLTVAAAYALFELYLRPCRLLPWCSPPIFGLGLYQYVFMLPLFVVVAIFPVRRGLFARAEVYRVRAGLRALGSFLLAVVVEDVFFFLFAATPIKPGTFTTQWGYVALPGMVIPNWYIVFIALSVFAFGLASRWGRGRQ